MFNITKDPLLVLPFALALTPHLLLPALSSHPLLLSLLLLPETLCFMWTSLRNRTLSRLVREDALTKALTRTAFEEAMEKERKRMRREGRETGLVVGFLDVDDFKQVNDT